MGGPEAAEHRFLGSGQLRRGNLAILAGFQLGKDFSPGLAFFVKVNSGRHGDDALGPVVGRTDGIAQGVLFPDVYKQLAGHAPTEEGIEYLHGREGRVPIGDGSHKSHTQLSLGYVHGLHHVVSRTGVEAGLGRKGLPLTGNPGQHGLQKLGHLAAFGAAHIENFQCAAAKNLLVVLIQPLGGDGTDLLRLAQTGQTETVFLAQNPQQPAHGVNPLVVALGLNGGNQIFLFAFHKGFPKSPVFHRGIQQQFFQKCHHGLQHRISRQG